MSATDHTTTTHHLTTRGQDVELTVTDHGAGHPVLLLHGGGGPASVASFADLVTTARHARVITPTHPGFGGTPRPSTMDGVRALAELYADLVEHLGLHDVTVVGNSVGGWVAAEMALRASQRVSSVVLVDAVGLRIDAHPIVDFFSLTMDQVTDLSYAEPDRFRVDVDAVPEPARQAMAGNRAALLSYGGRSMCDDTLLERLPGITTPTLVVWGAADRVVPPEHGRAYADRIPDATFDLIAEAGHLPQLETPDRLLSDVWDFADRHAGISHLDARRPTGPVGSAGAARGRRGTTT